MNNPDPDNLFYDPQRNDWNSGDLSAGGTEGSGNYDKDASDVTEAIARFKALPLRHASCLNSTIGILILECGHEFSVPELRNKESGIEIGISKLTKQIKVRCWECYEIGMMSAQTMIDRA